MRKSETENFGFGKNHFRLRYRNRTLVSVPDTETWFRLYIKNQSTVFMKTVVKYVNYQFIKSITYCVFEIITKEEHFRKHL